VPFATVLIIPMVMAMAVAIVVVIIIIIILRFRKRPGASRLALVDTYVLRGWLLCAILVARYADVQWKYDERVLAASDLEQVGRTEWPALNGCHLRVFYWALQGELIWWHGKLKVCHKRVAVLRAVGS
jgi:hypothetical protein